MKKYFIPGLFALCTVILLTIQFWPNNKPANNLPQQQKQTTNVKKEETAKRKTTAKYEIDAFDKKVSVATKADNVTSAINMMLIKFFRTDGTSYCTIYFNKVAKDWWFFDRKYIEAKINDKNIYYLKVKNTESEVFSTGDTYTSCYANLNDEVLNAINNEEKITFRIRFENRPNAIWEPSKETIKNFQEVINTDKDGMINI